MNRHFGVPMLASVSIGLSLSVCVSAHDEGFEQHAAHEHGKVTVNVALEKHTLDIEIDAPAVNVVGFEHAPRTQQEKAAVAEAARLLKSGGGLFDMPPGARCRLTAAEVTEPHWAQGEHHAYEARYSYECAAPEQLRWLAPALLGKLRDVHEARINLITSSGQRSQTVTSARERVSLQSERT